MAKVKDITQAKGNQIYSITPDATVYSALEQLFEKNISALLVMEGEKPLGIFTDSLSTMAHFFSYINSDITAAVNYEQQDNDLNLL